MLKCAADTAIRHFWIEIVIDDANFDVGNRSPNRDLAG